MPALRFAAVGLDGEVDVGTVGKVERLDGVEGAVFVARANFSSFVTRLDGGFSSYVSSSRHARSLNPLNSAVATGAVEGFVGEGVRVAVQFAADVLDGEIRETRGELFGALEERAQIGVLHFVESLHLADEEFGIAQDAEMRDTGGGGEIERGDERVVFGDVVSGAADVFADFLEQRAVGAADNHRVGRGARIAAGGAVNMSDVQIGGALGLAEETRAVNSMFGARARFHWNRRTARQVEAAPLLDAERNIECACRFRN